MPCSYEIGVQHVIWAFSPWPFFDTEQEAATYVLGQTGDMPPAPLTFALGAVLAASAQPVLAAAGVIPRIGPSGPNRLAVWGLATALLARGVAGPLFNSGATDEFATWNLRLSSPLCLVLAAGVTAGAAMNGALPARCHAFLKDRCRIPLRDGR